MAEFDIAKYLKEHSLGSFGKFNGYVDVQPLKEVEDEIELEKEIPYEGPEPKLTGNGGGDSFEQAETVSEESDDHTPGRMMDLGGEQIEQGIIALLDNGFEPQDIMELCKMFIKDHFRARARGKQY